jgi:hypothetical protein
MSGQPARGRIRVRGWARRGLLLALPLLLLAVAAAAFAIAPSGVSPPASVRPDQRLLPPTPRASMPAAAIGARVTVSAAAMSEGGHALSRPAGRVHRRRVARVEP